MALVVSRSSKRNTAILAVLASGRPDHIVDAVGTLIREGAGQVVRRRRGAVGKEARTAEVFFKHAQKCPDESAAGSR
jgi:hypothetical protein